MPGAVIKLTAGPPSAADLSVDLWRKMQQEEEEGLVIIPDDDAAFDSSARLGWLSCLTQVEELAPDVFNLWFTVMERGWAFEWAEDAETGARSTKWAMYPFASEELSAVQAEEFAAARKRKGLDAVNPSEHLLGLSELAHHVAAPPSLLSAMATCATADLQWTLLKDHLHRQMTAVASSEAVKTLVRKEIDRSQKEAHLKLQLKALNEELRGLQGNADMDEADELDHRAASLPLSEAALKHVTKLAKRMRGLQSSSSEYAVLHAQGEALLALPWGKLSGDGASAPEDNSLVRAQMALEEGHYGLEKVKRRLLQYLAVRRLTPNAPSPVLCLAGPPGVGKTSLAASLARALGKPMVRISLGGVSDESEMRGHRRTYVGAMPGRIIKAVTEAGVMDPLILLDEVDKLGKTAHRGDPSAALLEVLDPEQNPAFKDHYMEVPWDLSGCVFVCTANEVDRIPGPLLDRMELIQLSSYTPEEKRAIFHRHLWPSQVKAHGLQESQIRWDPDTQEEMVEALCSRYGREAGVRQLKQKTAGLLRHLALLAAEEPLKELSQQEWTIDWAMLTAALGPCPPLGADGGCAGRDPAAGSVLGLAWTRNGGEVLWIEAVSSAKKAGKDKAPNLKLTGTLGDVMKESAHTALTLALADSESKMADIPADLHVHLPAGAVPKDGPSAGVALYWVLRSVLGGEKLRQDVAITGEVSLLGRVLPVGGIKEKVLAAMKAGARKVLLPEENRQDWEQEVTEEAKAHLEVVFLRRVEEAAPHLLA